MDIPFGSAYSRGAIAVSEHKSRARLDPVYLQWMCARAREFFPFGFARIPRSVLFVRFFFFYYSSDT